MAFNVRIFSYKGIRQIPQLLVRQFNADSVFVVDEPYLWQQTISVSSVAASTVAQDPDKGTIVRIEIPDNQAIRYEFNPPGRTAIAGTNSPRLTGSDQFPWVKGATLSLIDAVNLP